MADQKYVEINVVEWTNGNREVALYFPGFDQMLTLSVDAARHMAFLLMECADFVQPPFGEPEDSGESIFGPLEDIETEEDPNDEEDDEDDEDD